jgi:hypothetical protein
LFLVLFITIKGGAEGLTSDPPISLKKKKKIN